MKRAFRLLGVVGLLVLSGGSPTLGQGASQSVGIRAVVPKFCTVGGQIRAAEFVVRIEVSVDGTISARADAFDTNSAICNTAATIAAVSLQDGARPVAVSTGGDVIDYVAQVSFGSATATVATSGAVLSGAPGRMMNGVTAVATRDALRVSVMPIRRSSAPAGRVYVDTLRVVLTPQ